MKIAENVLKPQCEPRTIEEIIKSDDIIEEFVYDWLNALIIFTNGTRINNVFVLERALVYEKYLLQTDVDYNGEPYYLCECCDCEGKVVLTLKEMRLFYCEDLSNVLKVGTEINGATILGHTARTNRSLSHLGEYLLRCNECSNIFLMNADYIHCETELPKIQSCICVCQHRE